MATSFFGGAFFGGEFFSEPTGGVAKTGTGGIDPEDGLRRRRIVKPTGILHRPVKARPSVQERIDDSAGIAAEIAGRIALEFAEESAALQARPPVVEMSLSEIEAEIGSLLRKKMRTDEDEVLLLILMAAAVA